MSLLAHPDLPHKADRKTRSTQGSVAIVVSPAMPLDEAGAAASRNPVRSPERSRSRHRAHNEAVDVISKAQSALENIGLGLLVPALNEDLVSVAEHQGATPVPF